MPNTLGRCGNRIVRIDLSTSLTEMHDRMPEFMLYEKLPPHDVTWDVPNETLDAVFGEA